MQPPLLSIVVLTWNEEHNIRDCLLALAKQRSDAFEVIVVDAGSTDDTASVVRQCASTLPFPLHLHIGPTRMPIGAARNLGVHLAHAARIAFLSADAQLRPGWVSQAIYTLARADMAFGPQVHAPLRWSLGAAVRGLRYEFPRESITNPLRYASNVAAAYNRDVLEQFPFDPWANAAEDLLLARRAHDAGYVPNYNPYMIADHRDVASLRQELRKNVREGAGWGIYRRELGIRWLLLGWLFALLAATATIAVNPALGLLTLLGILWLPALRRGARRRGTMPLRHLAAGVAISPAFDLVFLVQYLRGLALPYKRPPPTSLGEPT